MITNSWVTIPIWSRMAWCRCRLSFHIHPMLLHNICNKTVISSKASHRNMQLYIKILHHICVSILCPQRAGEDQIAVLTMGEGEEKMDCEYRFNLFNCHFTDTVISFLSTLLFSFYHLSKQLHLIIFGCLLINHCFWLCWLNNSSIILLDAYDVLHSASINQSISWLNWIDLLILHLRPCQKMCLSYWVR